MTVDGGIAVIIHHIEHIARAVGDTDTRNISVRQRTYRFAYGATGLEIQSAMKMVGTYLAKVTGEMMGKSKGGVKEASCARAPTDIKKKDKMTDFMYIFIAVTSYDKRRQR